LTVLGDHGRDRFAQPVPRQQLLLATAMSQLGENDIV
jgi:hypothetical protein